MRLLVCNFVLRGSRGERSCLLLVVLVFVVVRRVVIGVQKIAIIVVKGGRSVLVRRFVEERYGVG